MKKLFLISFLILAGSGALFMPANTHGATASGGCDKGTCTYVPLEPLPCPTENPNCQTGVDFPGYVSAMFRLAITLGALFAVLMLVIAGIGYMVADSGVQIDTAKKRATSALYGLLLLTACWLILYTINPNLLRFDLFKTELDRVAQKNTSSGIPSSAPEPNITIRSVPQIEQECISKNMVMRPGPDSQLGCFLP